MSEPADKLRRPPDNLTELLSQWQEADPRSWSAEEVEAWGGKAVALGQPTSAYDILKWGMERFPDDAAIAYRASLALTNSGSLVRAAKVVNDLLDVLPTDHPRYVDSRSLAGRIAKDRWSKLPPGPGRDFAGDHAVEHYLAAYQVTGDPFPGINAASMCVLTGRTDEGRRIAREVRATCLAQRDAGRLDHWGLATLGEAALLLGEVSEAEDGYAKAVEAAGGRTGDVAAMRRQLHLLARHLDVGPNLHEILKAPLIVAFLGHAIDRPGRQEPSFPWELEGPVRDAVRETLRRLEPGIVYSSAACGSELLFVEAAQEMGCPECHVVLPFHEEEFVPTSVAYAGAGWEERFHAALAKATSVSYGIRESYLGDGPVLFKYSYDMSLGAALLRGRQLHGAVVLLAVLDRAPGAEESSTLPSLEAWQDEFRVETIDLAALRARHWDLQQAQPLAAPTTEPAAEDAHGTDNWGRRGVRTMLFADIVGFSKLSERHAPSFFVHFLGQVSQVIERSQIRPAFRNTWGDGLFMVFRDVRKAADFALDLRDAINGMDWLSVGLPAGISIRIGMHTGPVFPAHDPIIDQENFFGSHVNLAARIEPITAPGAVYLSEATASLLAREHSDIACDYLGPVPLAKAYGTTKLYQLRRSNETG